MSRAALTLAQELSHPFSLAVALDYAAMLHQFRREAICRPRAGRGGHHDSVRSRGLRITWPGGRLMQGWAQVAQGQDEAGMAQIRRGLAALRATGRNCALPYYLALLAEACGQTGRPQKGLTLLAEALAQGRTRLGSVPRQRRNCIGSRENSCWRRRQTTEVEAGRASIRPSPWPAASRPSLGAAGGDEPESPVAAPG